MWGVLGGWLASVIGTGIGRFAAQGGLTFVFYQGLEPARDWLLQYLAASFAAAGELYVSMVSMLRIDDVLAVLLAAYLARAAWQVSGLVR